MFVGICEASVSVLCPMFVRTRIHESDRNAPAEVLAAEEARGGAEIMRTAIGGLVDSGIDPSVVGEHVRSAVEDDRFWVLPHEEVKPAVRARADRIANQEHPAISAELFGGI